MASAQPLAGVSSNPPKALSWLPMCISHIRATLALEEAPCITPSTLAIWWLMVLTQSRMRLSLMVSGKPVMECQIWPPLAGTWLIQ